MRKLLATLVSASFLFACGGSQPPPESGDVSDPDVDAAQGDLGDPGEPAATDDTPSDDAPDSGGIVRDADGDGKPDEAGGGCEGKTETQCKISGGCAWSDAGKCVEADGM